MNNLLSSYNEFAVAIPEQAHERAKSHLLQHVGEEDIAFAVWYPSHGQRRLTGLVYEVILPEDGDRQVHGNVSFNPQFFTRALQKAMDCGGGLALMHSHLGPGWQNLSPDDIRAEGGHAGAVVTATGLPFLGLTLGTDGAWSGRFWQRTAPRKYEPLWCATARCVGQGLAATFHPTLRPMPGYREEQERSSGVWGSAAHTTINNLRIGVVGLGSVGSLVGEALARQGLQDLVYLDFDRIQPRNLDRTAGATRLDLGRLKVQVAADHAHRCSTAAQMRVEAVPYSVVEPEGFRAALDCDLLFCCVDRPWGRQVMNHLAYAHLIPVVNGGILVRLRRERMVGADWHVHTVAPGRRCMECWKAYDPGDVGLEMEGMLDDPSYLKQLDPTHPLLRHENVFPFSMNVASLEFLQMASMVIGPIVNVGDQNYHFVGGNLDRKDDPVCLDTCLTWSRVATGDTRKGFTGVDRAATGSRQRAP